MKVWGLSICLLVGLLGSLLVKGVTAQTAVILITEVYYNTPGDDSLEEWIEIANIGTAVADLSRVKIGDEETAGQREGMLRFPDGAEIAPAQAIIVAQTAVGFRQLFGFNPDYEISDSDDNVPNMRNFPLWAGGDLGLANDGDEILLLGAQNQLLDTLNYGDSLVYFAPAILNVFTGQSIERIPANCDSNSAADWQPTSRPTPGQITLDGECATPIDPAELEDLPTIGEIQGEDNVSPYVNQIVSFRGVVTGQYEDRNAAGITYYTLFVQDGIGQEDGDSATSDGMAVFLGRQRPSTTIGDQIRITGQVSEFFGLTEISDEGLEMLVESSDNDLPPSIPIDPSADSAAQKEYLERFEGMRVMLDGEVAVLGATFSGCSFAVRSDGESGRVFVRQSGDPVGLIIPILHTSDVACGDFPHVKTGDGMTGIVGPLHYHFDQFKIVQQDVGTLQVNEGATAVIPQPLPITPDQFTLASFNLENYFDGIDDTGNDAEPKLSPDELAVKQKKIAYAVAHVLGCPTLIAVQEVENEALLSDLADTVAVDCGFIYEVTHRESADGRGIDVALLSNPQVVQVVSADLRQGCTSINTGIVDESADCAMGEQPLFSRPPLAVGLVVDERPLTILINHFKSKRGGEWETAPRRIAQAEHINAIVADLLVQDALARILVVGDFNDYEQSPPLLTMTESGQLTNLLQHIPDTQRYTYVFSGVSQTIDGLLASPQLASEMADITIQHVNADFPDSWATDLSPERIGYKSTDHDLPLVVFDLPPRLPTPEPTAVTPTSLPTSTPSPTVPIETNTDGLWLWLIGGMGLVTAVGGFIILRKK